MAWAMSVPMPVTMGMAMTVMMIMAIAFVMMVVSCVLHHLTLFAGFCGISDGTLDADRGRSAGWCRHRLQTEGQDFDCLQRRKSDTGHIGEVRREAPQPVLFIHHLDDNRPVIFQHMSAMEVR